MDYIPKTKEVVQVKRNTIEQEIKAEGNEADEELLCDTSSISTVEAIYILLHDVYKKDSLHEYFLKESYLDTLSNIGRIGYFLWDEQKIAMQPFSDKEKEGEHKANNIMQLNAISKFIQILEQQLEKHEKSIFYRGHEDVTYRLIPSILREKNWIEHEDYMCNQIIMRKTLEFDHCHSNFERLVLMQHYELPTRLLDLTSNPLVALYFACLNTDVDGCVILFAEEEDKIKYGDSDCIRIASALSRLNKKEKEQVFKITKDKDPGFDKLASEISAEKPGFKNIIKAKDLHTCHVVRANYSNNERILRQAGLFITTIDPEQVEAGIEELRYKQYDKNLSCNKNVVIHIPSNMKKELLRLLDIMDINKASLYTSIHDIASYIKEMTKKM